MEGKAKKFIGVLCLSLVFAVLAAGCGSSHGGSGGGGTPPASGGPAITTTFLPLGTPNQPYNATLAASGGTGTYTWQVNGGGLPGNVSLNPATGVISGTPTTSFNAPVTFKVQDSGGGSDQKTFTLTIGTAPQVTTTSVPAGTVGTPYSTTLTATGGFAPLTWTLSTQPGFNALPAGLSLSPNGTISGTPTAKGSTTFIANVKDAAGNSGGTPALTLTIN